ncbi:MAG: membrane dipeptidase [Roseivirga sp.]|jgi:membrane dipeptidase
MISRKNFLKQSALMAGATFLLPKWSFLIQDQPLRIIDLHAHPGLFFRKGSDMYPGDDAVGQRIADIRKSGVQMAFFSLVADSPLLVRTTEGIVVEGSYQKGEGWAEYKKQLAIFMELATQNKMSIAISYKYLADTENSLALLSCEGGDFLDGEIDNVERAYQDGIRSIQLVHYAQNNVGDLQTQPAVYNGLSDFGKATVQKMNELGMIIDVAHASFKTVADVAEITSAPILLSHSILKTEEDRPISIRAITPAHAKLVADTGGLIGAWPSGFSKDINDFADQTLRMIDVVGIDHVGIGTDMDANFQPVITNYGEVSSWAALLENRGLSKTEIDKVLYGNAERLIKNILK